MRAPLRGRALSMIARTASSWCARISAFPDEDGYPFHLAEAPSGGLRLSDCGHTLMHISYEHDIDSFLWPGHGGCCLSA